MFDLPKSITIQDKDYAIRNDGDYRVVMDCFLALTDPELEQTERILAALIIFYADFNSIEDMLCIKDIDPFIKQMYWFMNCGQKEHDRRSPKLIDWEQDSQLIFSAVNKVAGKEIRAEKYMHWWTFMGYYMGIGECTLSLIIAIRYKIAHNKKLEKHEKDFKRENPHYFVWERQSIEDSEADKLFEELWNK